MGRWLALTNYGNIPKRIKNNEKFDQDNDRAMILEAKKSDSKSLMSKDCDDALKQIVDQEYAADLQDEFGDVLCYGIAFFQKSAMIKKL